MFPFKIKICGLRVADDAIAAVKYGADALGLNFFRPGPRYVDPKTAQQIIDSVTNWCRESASNPAGEDAASPEPQMPKMVGVFVNEDICSMVDIAKSLCLDAIQLHGDEDVCLVSKIRDVLDQREIECTLIRAIRSKSFEAQAADHSCQVEGVNSEIHRWVEAGIDAVLLDAAEPGLYGGTGKPLDWSMYARLDHRDRIMLAGGLNPCNIEQAIRVANAQSVDVASGVETEPGVKDPIKMKSFIEAAHRALIRV